VSDRSAIEWTRGEDGSPGATWNPTRGCSRVSPGCEGCYAERLAGRFAGPGMPFEGLVRRTAQGARWTGAVRLLPDQLSLPLRWRRPRTIFVDSVSDLFHEKVPDAFIAAVFGIAAAAPWHRFILLTKRSERLPRWFAWLDAQRGAWSGPGSETMECDWRVHAVAHAAFEATGYDGEIGPLPEAWPLPNVWLGVSVEDQRAADERIPALLATPAAVRFLSCEPLLGAVDLSKWFGGLGSPVRRDNPGPTDEPRTVRGGHARSEPSGSVTGTVAEPQLDPAGAAASRTRPSISWVIVGGESGPGARPMHPAWARALREQCVAARVPFFFKQWGEWAPEMQGAADWPDPLDAGATLWPDGRVFWGPGRGTALDDGCTFARLGKKRAGRELDGRTWDQMPEVHRG
jgi:protein gp37